MNYRIYGETSRGWRAVDNVADKDKAIEIGQNLNPRDYAKYMIIEHDSKNNEDIPIIVETLSENCKVEIGNFDTGIQINVAEIRVGNKRRDNSEKNNDKSANERENSRTD